MKNYATFVITLYEGIREDATARWPDIRSKMEKDLSYLRRAFEQRGLAFFTLTLPDYGHWIDRSLDHGSFYDRDDIPRGIPLHRGRPVLFRGLLAKVFDTDGLLRAHADHGAVLFLRALTQSLKKMEEPVLPSTLRKTVKEFLDVEEKLPRSHPNTWDSDVPTWGARHGHPLWGTPVDSRKGQVDFFDLGDNRRSDIPWDTLRLLCRRVTSEIGQPSYHSLRPKHGPGAVSDKGWKSKFDFPSWPRKLGLWFPFDWFGSGDFSVDCFVPDEIEPPSRLCAVPKNRKAPRLICKEPIAHQWMQQSIWRWLRRRIPLTTIGRSVSFTDQEKSRKLALSASHDRSYATLDLSAASDRLSTRLVEYVFQGSELLDHMHACRSRAMEQTLVPELSKLVLLRKFATMGSTLTFPIQSIVFTILSVWALRLYEGRENDWIGWKRDFDRVRVFGDDIIVPSHAFGITKFVLNECGLLVNTLKSFGGVSFRESCGMDAFDGVDVTPARHKLPYSGDANSTAALIEYSNNLFSKGFWKTSDKVLGFLPDKIRKLLVCHGPRDGALGLLSFSGNDWHLRKLKYDRDYQRNYVERLGFYAKVSHVQGLRNSSLIQFFTEDPAARRFRLGLVSDLTDWQSGHATVGSLKMRKSRVYL